MKKYLFLLMVGSLFTIQHAFAQASKADIDKKREEIKNNSSSFQKIDTINDSAGYRYVYVKDKKLQLITIYHKDQNIDKNVEWYFFNGKEIYTEQTWTDRTSGKIIDNEKFYLVDSKPIAWIRNDGVTVDTASQEFKKEALITANYAKRSEAYYANTLNGGSK